jgi:hypothetical protein
LLWSQSTAIRRRPATSRRFRLERLEARRDELMLTKFGRKKAIRRDIEDILDLLQASLKLVAALDQLFTVRRELQG